MRVMDFAQMASLAFISFRNVLLSVDTIGNRLGLGAGVGEPYVYSDFRKENSYYTRRHRDPNQTCRYTPSGRFLGMLKRILISKPVD
jgi:hypothetical protein